MPNTISIVIKKDENIFSDDPERSYHIDFKDLKYIYDNDVVKKGEICKIIEMIHISAIRIVYENSITILECEIKNKCSDASWLVYKQVRDVIPAIAKMAEHLKSLYEQMHGNIDADVDRKQIDNIIKVLQTQVNTCEVDLKMFQYDLLLIENNIKKCKENIEAVENEGNLEDIKISFERLQQDFANQLKQCEALISTHNSMLEMLKQVQETEARVQETKELTKSLEENLRQKSEENTKLRERCEKLQETEARAKLETKELVKSLEENLRQKSKENTELKERCEKLQETEARAKLETEGLVKSLEDKLCQKSEENTKLRERCEIKCEKLQETEARIQEMEKLVQSLEEILRQKSEENTELRERCDTECEKGHSTREIVCMICKRMERMVKNCSEIHQECPCCVLQGMPPDERDGLVGELEVECVCCRCLPKNVRNFIDDVTNAIQNHSLDLCDIHSEIGWQL